MIRVPRIFVSIASYRDRELPFTIQDLLAKAKRPELIRVGVLAQVNLATDVDCLYQGDHRVQQLVVPHTASRGACWARAKILNQLMGDEDYFLQIDSHSRFVQDWDDILFKAHCDVGDPKAIFSCYPVDYKPPDKLGVLVYVYHRTKKFAQDKLPVIESDTKPFSAAPKEAKPNALFAGGCTFGPSQAFRQVKYDPNLYFIGEEITMAVRLWTHGWNIYTPSIGFMYHNYNTHEKENKRPLHWEDHPQWGTQNKLAMKRVRHILGIEQSDTDEALVNLDLYGLGTQRTLEEFERFSGIYFKEQRLEEKAFLGNFGY